MGLCVGQNVAQNVAHTAREGLGDLELKCQFNLVARESIVCQFGSSSQKDRSSSAMASEELDLVIIGGGKHNPPTSQKCILSLTRQEYPASARSAQSSPSTVPIYQSPYSRTSLLSAAYGPMSDSTQASRRTMSWAVMNSAISLCATISALM